jgi:hypothetical protein
MRSRLDGVSSGATPSAFPIFAIVAVAPFISSLPDFVVTLLVVFVFRSGSDDACPSKIL